MKKEINTVIKLWHIRTFLILKIPFIIFSVYFCDLNPAYPYEQPTHVTITEKAVGQAANYATFVSNFQLNGDESIKSGSYHEDDGYLTLSRSRHHFYDPINGQGLLAPFPVCMFTCKPSLAWGFNDIKNEYSWTKAREYMYIALTGQNFNGEPIAITSNQRNIYFQKMFQSVGRDMHLVQDLAVPAHVRNDLHLPVGLARGLYEDYTLNHYNFGWALGYPTVGLSQFSDFWDSPQGLAVFTNRNFISQDTNFDNFDINGNLFYQFPQMNGIITKTETVINQFGQTVQVDVDYGRNVIQDIYTGDLFTNDQLTAFSVFDFEAQEILGEHVYSLNDFTMQSAANILVRRAVGYSAGLLDYFFRGQLDVTPAQGGLNVKNMSAETMFSGNLSIYYDSISPNDGSLIRLGLVGIDLPSALDPGQEIFIQFIRPTNNIKPGQYIVVFQGQLGAEEGAVIGAVTPAPLFYVSKRSGVYKIFRMDADGSNQEVVYDNPDPNITISKLAPSPDGKTLAFTVVGPRIFLLDLTTGALTEFTQGDWPDWSPDGNTIVFERDVTPPEAFVQGGQLFSVIEIFAKNVLNGNEVQLTHTYTPNSGNTSGSFNGHPAFSPDGKTIAYTRWPADETDCNNTTGLVIYLMDASGTSSRAVTCDDSKAWFDESPTWSPDGREIAFLRRWVNEYDRLYKVSVDTKTIAKLTDSDGTVYAEFTPSWSSDGKVIAIGSNRDGNFDIWRVDANAGSYLNNLTIGNTDIDGFPAYMK